jgi:hypothetical protein
MVTLRGALIPRVEPTRPYLLPLVESPQASRHVSSAAALARFALESAELTDDHRLNC